MIRQVMDVSKVVEKVMKLDCGTFKLVELFHRTVSPCYGSTVFLFKLI